MKEMEKTQELNLITSDENQVSMIAFEHVRVEEMKVKDTLEGEGAVVSRIEKVGESKVIEGM